MNIMNSTNPMNFSEKKLSIEELTELADLMLFTIGIDGLRDCLGELAEDSKTEEDRQIWMDALAILNGEATYNIETGELKRNEKP